MSDKVHGGNGVKAGQTSVSLPFRLLSTAGAAVTGKAATDLTAYYWRQGGSPTSISLSDLAAINSSYSSGGVKEASSSNMPGLYRIDVPDAAFATGADWVALAIKCSGSMDYEVFIPLETVGNSETYARIGAPVGASISADVAAVDSDVWSYSTRTLTQGAASVTSTVSGSTVTVYRGTSWSITLTGLGALTGYSKLWFTVKADTKHTDAQALVQILESSSTADSDGLLYLNGAAAATAAQGSITVNDASTGSITIALDEAASALLTPASNLHYDVKVLNGGAVSVLADGVKKFVISPDVTRTVA